MRNSIGRRGWQPVGIVTIGLIGSLAWLAAPAVAAWTVETPITYYWDGSALTDAVAARAAAAGFNLVSVTTSAELDVAQLHGLRVMWSGSLDDATVSSIRNHSALYSYHVADEPSASQFSAIAETVSRLHSLDANHLAYINLLPTYASSDQLGASDYTAYVNQYMSTVQPSLLSYDHYHFMTDGVDTPNYFANLSMISHTARNAGVPFMGWIQACAAGDSAGAGYRLPGSGELRFLAYTQLAYGAQGISAYACNVPDETHSDFYSTLAPNPDDSPTSTYTALQSINPEIISIAKKLQPMRHIGTYHMGNLPPYDSAGIPWESRPRYLPYSSPFKLSPSVPYSVYEANTPVEGAVLGLFGLNATLGDATMALVVNLDYSNEFSTTVTGPGNLSIFNPATSQWTPTGHPYAELNLLPGGGVLVGLTSEVPEPSAAVILGAALTSLAAVQMRKRK